MLQSEAWQAAPVKIIRCQNYKYFGALHHTKNCRVLILLALISTYNIPCLLQKNLITVYPVDF
jgi:hypothetical protein